VPRQQLESTRLDQNCSRPGKHRDDGSHDGPCPQLPGPWPSKILHNRRGVQKRWPGQKLQERPPESADSQDTCDHQPRNRDPDARAAGQASCGREQPGGGDQPQDHDRKDQAQGYGVRPLNISNDVGEQDASRTSTPSSAARPSQAPTRRRRAQVRRLAPIFSVMRVNPPVRRYDVASGKSRTHDGACATMTQSGRDEGDLAWTGI
jgi:hypothetical protein